MTDLTIYDVGIDAMRPVTQEDVDRLTNASLVMSRLRHVIRTAEMMAHDALVGTYAIDQFYAKVAEFTNYPRTGKDSAHGQAAKTAEGL